MSAELRRKTFETEVRAEDRRRIRFVISTGDVDRDNDTIDPAGWDLGEYRKNPVVQWAHDAKSLPVARANDVRVEKGQLVADAEFVPGSIYPFAETVYQMLKAGYLRATSVGFRAIEYAMNQARGGIDFKRQELLEFSIVPVPANPGALMVGRDVNEPAVKAWLGGYDTESVIAIADEDDVFIEVDDDTGSALAMLAAEGRAKMARMRMNPARLAGLIEPVVYDVDERLLAQLTADVVGEAISRLYSETVERTLNKLRGRAD